MINQIARLGVDDVPIASIERLIAWTQTTIEVAITRSQSSRDATNRSRYILGDCTGPTCSRPKCSVYFSDQLGHSHRPILVQRA
jgi:hypothetical protein